MHKASITIAFFWIIGTALMFIMNWDANDMQFNAILASPNIEAIFGRDDYGRSIIYRLFAGFKNSIEIILVVSLISCTTGVVIGTVSGYIGGKFDAIVSFIINLFMSFPGILLAIAFAAMLNPGKLNLILALSIGGWVSYARLSRGQALMVKNFEYVKASKSMGASHWWIVARHLIPSLSTPLLVEATYAVAGLIIAEASLSFLGLGLQAPEASWGAMMRDSVRYLLVSPHYAIFVGMSIMSIVYCINHTGDYLHNYFNIKESLTKN